MSLPKFETGVRELTDIRVSQVHACISTWGNKMEKTRRFCSLPRELAWQILGHIHAVRNLCVMLFHILKRIFATRSERRVSGKLKLFFPPLAGLLSMGGPCYRKRLSANENVID